jgi:CDP-glycerol glycerophosphotransferase (TagB/SpsB family)
VNFLLFATENYALEILRPLQQAIEDAGHQAAWYFSKPVDAAWLEQLPVLETVSSVRAFDPAAVFVPGNWVPPFFPGLKVQVFHGFGIEKKGHFRIRGFFDLYCTHGPLTTVPFERLAREHGHFRVVETGWPKVDPLFRMRPKRAPGGRPRLLYAPTFSPSLTSAGALRDPLIELAETGSHDIVVKFHPKMDPVLADGYRKRQSARLSVSDGPSILPLMQASDLLLTDTSSVVYEYLLLERPVVTFRNARPGPQVVDFHEPQDLRQVLQQTWANRSVVVERARPVAENMHPWRDGRSSQRVLQATLEMLENPPGDLRPKPLNLWRRWQVRRRMGYYRWR